MAEVLPRHSPGFSDGTSTLTFIEPEGRVERLPRIVLVGEVNSGKTTLVNFLLQAELLVADIVPNTLCPTLLRFGDTAHLRVHRGDGAVALRSLADLHRIGRESVQFIEVYLPSPVLRTMEILDLPGVVSVADAESKRTWVAAADVQIWCTPATQAWRASEAAKWQSLACPRNSALLVLTCRDQLSAHQLGEVSERISRETQRFFSQWTAIAASQAIAARNPRGEIVRNDLWGSAGVEDFITKLRDLLYQAMAPRRGLSPALSRALSSSTARELPHPVPSFESVSLRVLGAGAAAASAQQMAAIMAREFENYASLILGPWLRLNRPVLDRQAIEALIPKSETEILDYLLAADGRSSLAWVQGILKQIEAELIEAI
jgi:hypothetical protein